MEVSLRSSSNDEGSSRVWMALLEQHNPSSRVFHNLRRFIDAVSPTAPTTGLPLQGNPMATADANQNCVTIIRHSFLFLARSLASLISILLSFRALFTPETACCLHEQKMLLDYLLLLLLLCPPHSVLPSWWACLHSCTLLYGPLLSLVLVVILICYMLFVYYWLLQLCFY